ncbi:MAG: SIS domain-containing protein, partial [Lysobacter sp.]|nr:SIS domain-containing protein [Lysobacter sp.]
MYAEAEEAGDAVARQFAANADAVDDLSDYLRQRPPRFIVTCARGSSDHAATYGKYLFETQLGLVTASASPSVGSVYAIQPKLEDALFVAISQSGKSPDLVRNAEIAKAAGAHVVALVNVTDSPLARVADTVLGLHAGPETSVAATKSYLCSLAALLQLTARWSNDAALFNAVHALPDSLHAAFAQDWSPLVEGLKDARNLFVVGRGLGLGAAQEAALKFKETCGLHAEAFSSAEVKHGPMAIVGPGFPVLALAQDDGTGDGTVAVAEEFRVRGAPV